MCDWLWGETKWKGRSEEEEVNWGELRAHFVSLTLSAALCLFFRVSRRRSKRIPETHEQALWRASHRPSGRRHFCFLLSVFAISAGCVAKATRAKCDRPTKRQGCRRSGSSKSEI